MVLLTQINRLGLLFIVLFKLFNSLGLLNLMHKNPHMKNLYTLFSFLLFIAKKRINVVTLGSSNSKDFSVRGSQMV